ncbi:MAG: SLC13 family permease [Thermoanaerobaculia bacterium]|nr:SLC13 family permease [Thermoanaerobaculia bacterium]
MEASAFTLEIALTLGVTVASLALFLWGRWRLEVVGLLVMVSLILLGLVSPREGIAGFANEATVTVALMLGLSAGLVKTGAVDLLGEWIGELAGDEEWRFVAVVLVLVVPVSALINNTAAVAILLPMVVGLSRSKGMTPSRILMPLSFGSQFGGTLTLIGTSTNLLVAGIALDEGLPRFEIFTITPPAAVLAAAGAVYLLTVGRWLTPYREATTEERTSPDLREYLSELEVREASPLAGRRVDDSRLDREFGLRVVGVWRDGEEISPRGDGRSPLYFEEGDRVVVRGRVRGIADAVEGDRLSLGATAAEFPEEDLEDEEESEVQLAEMMVSPRSRVQGLSVGDLGEQLPERVTVLALERHGEEMGDPIWNIELEPGDILLVRGPWSRLQSLHSQGDLGLLGTVDLPERRTRRLWWAVGILASVVVLAATGATSILVAALLGMCAMLLTGCLRPQEVYQEMDWGVIILLGSLLALGTAMERTGTAEYLAHALLGLTRDLGPYGILAAFYLLTAVLTGVVTNNAAAVVMTPIAVATGSSLGLSPVPFVVAVMFAASNSFITPVGYQTNVFIYGPGGYEFSDFLRVGGPLLLLQAVLATWVIPVFLPF